MGTKANNPPVLALDSELHDALTQYCHESGKSFPAAINEAVGIFVESFLPSRLEALRAKAEAQAARPGKLAQVYRFPEQTKTK